MDPREETPSNNQHRPQARCLEFVEYYDDVLLHHLHILKQSVHRNYAGLCHNASLQHPHWLNHTLRKNDRDVRDAPSHGATRASLTKIQLKSFDGNILDFANFWENFSQCVGSRSNVSDANKFSYLVGQIDGEAARAIRGITQRSENCHRTVTALHLRFNYQERVIAKQMQIVPNAPIIRNITEVARMREMVEDVSVHLTSLLAAGVAGNLEHTIIPMVIGKLPIELGLPWRNVADTDDRSAHSFLHCIRREIQNGKVVQELRNNESSPVTDGYRRSRFVASQSLRSTVFWGTRSPSSQDLRSKPRSSFFCDETGHFATASTKVPTLAERRRIFIEK